MKKCGNCMRRMFLGWGGLPECCYGYEMAFNEKEEIDNAADCERYEEGTPPFLERDQYCPSSTAGDYGPGNPWDAPGMSVHDFI